MKGNITLEVLTTIDEVARKIKEVAGWYELNNGPVYFGARMLNKFESERYHEELTATGPDEFLLGPSKKLDGTAATELYDTENLYNFRVQTETHAPISRRSTAGYSDAHGELLDYDRTSDPDIHDNERGSLRDSDDSENTIVVGITATAKEGAALDNIQPDPEKLLENIRLNRKYYPYGYEQVLIVGNGNYTPDDGYDLDLSKDDIVMEFLKGDVVIREDRESNDGAVAVAILDIK